MDVTPSNKLRDADWVARCTQRIRLIEPELTDAQAADVARNLLSFQRTVAMPPDDAVKFVESELARPAPRFERRSTSRMSMPGRPHR